MASFAIAGTPTFNNFLFKYQYLCHGRKRLHLAMVIFCADYFSLSFNSIDLCMAACVKMLQTEKGGGQNQACEVEFLVRLRDFLVDVCFNEAWHTLEQALIVEILHCYTASVVQLINYCTKTLLGERDVFPY